jgi:hypothetical protein
MKKKFSTIGVKRGASARDARDHGKEYALRALRIIEGEKAFIIVNLFVGEGHV